MTNIQEYQYYDSIIYATSKVGSPDDPNPENHGNHTRNIANTRGESKEKENTMGSQSEVDAEAFIHHAVPNNRIRASSS